MTVKRIIEVLDEYQKWRRGVGIPMPDPEETLAAVDGAIRELRDFQRAKLHKKTSLESCIHRAKKETLYKAVEYVKRFCPFLDQR